MTETSPKSKSSKSGIIILLILVALFALPEIVVVGLKVVKWRPNTTTNQGELVVPARAINNLDLQTLDGKAVKFNDFHQKWTMIYFANAACDELCLKNLYQMRQVYIALGKEQDRCQRIFVLTSIAPIDQLKDKLKDYPGMTVITGTVQNIEAFSQQFIMPGAKTVDSQRIHLVDPLGNLP